MIVIAGDIGATNSRLALIKISRIKTGRWSYSWLLQKNLQNSDFKNFKEVLAAFQKSHARLKIESACFGIAGPIENAGSLKAKVAVTNLPWIIQAQEISKFLKIKKTWLINDLEAIASGIDLLKPREVRNILAGHANKKANRAVIAPGSGIGEAILYWDGANHHPIATEGGHCSFSPTGYTQVKLLQYLTQEFSHVSWERVLSGPGIYNLYKFLKTDLNLPDAIETLPEFSKVNPSTLVTQEALNDNSSLCKSTLDLFLKILANESANLALKSLAHGGVYIAGGIVPKISSLLKKESFSEAFLNKGRMSGLLKDIPVHLVLNDKVGILGAAKYSYLKQTKKNN